MSVATTPSAPHICFVALDTYPVLAGRDDLAGVGGAQVQQSILGRALAAAGIRVTFICMDYGQADKVEIDGIRVLKAYGLEEGTKWLRVIHPRMTRLWAAMARADADIYYQRCSGITTGVVAAFCAAYGKPFIYAGASDLDFSPGPSSTILPGRRDRAIYRWGLRNSSCVVTQSERQMAMLRANYGREGVLIPSCYDDGAVHPADVGEGTEVLWVGMIRPIKRPEFFLEMARRLPSHRFRMIGGPIMGSAPEVLAYYENIQRQALALPNLEFMGFVPYAKVHSYFDKARVFVNTSEHEGFPNTFLQAWARRVPAMAFFDTGSRIGGQPVYPVVQNLGQAVTCLNRLMTDTTFHGATATCSADYFQQNHAAVVTVARYKSLFASLLAGGGR